jgi:hypothetical protein
MGYAINNKQTQHHACLNLKLLQFFSIPFVLKKGGGLGLSIIASP